VGRLSSVLNMTVKELLALGPAVAPILGRYSIDICRYQALALRAAARIAGAEAEEVAGALLRAGLPALRDGDTELRMVAGPTRR
jgi:hypothetical protein